MCILYAYEVSLKVSSKCIHPNYFFYWFECFHMICPNLSSAPCIEKLKDSKNNHKNMFLLHIFNEIGQWDWEGIQSQTGDNLLCVMRVWSRNLICNEVATNEKLFLPDREFLIYKTPRFTHLTLSCAQGSFYTVLKVEQAWDLWPHIFSWFLHHKAFLVDDFGAKI